MAIDSEKTKFVARESCYVTKNQISNRVALGGGVRYSKRKTKFVGRESCYVNKNQISKQVTLKGDALELYLSEYYFTDDFVSDLGPVTNLLIE